MNSKVDEASRKVTRCELALDEAMDELKQLQDAMAIIKRKRDQAQENVNSWQLQLWEAEKELEKAHALV